MAKRSFSIKNFSILAVLAGFAYHLPIYGFFGPNCESKIGDAALDSPGDSLVAIREKKELDFYKNYLLCKDLVALSVEKDSSANKLYNEAASSINRKEIVELHLCHYKGILKRGSVDTKCILRIEKMDMGDHDKNFVTAGAGCPKENSENNFESVDPGLEMCNRARDSKEKLRYRPKGTKVVLCEEKEPKCILAFHENFAPAGAEMVTLGSAYSHKPITILSPPAAPSKADDTAKKSVGSASANLNSCSCDLCGDIKKCKTECQQATQNCTYLYKVKSDALTKCEPNKKSIAEKDFKSKTLSEIKLICKKK